MFCILRNSEQRSHRFLSFIKRLFSLAIDIQHISLNNFTRIFRRFFFKLALRVNRRHPDRLFLGSPGSSLLFLFGSKYTLMESAFVNNEREVKKIKIRFRNYLQSDFVLTILKSL